MILRSEMVLPWGPVSPVAESVDSSLGIIDSFGEEVPAVELLVALIVAAHRGKVRPGGRSGVIGRSGKFVGQVEGLVCVGETGVGDGQLGASMTSTEDARVVEVALSEASCVFGVCDETAGCIDGVVEGSTHCGGCCEATFGLLNSGRSLLLPRSGIFECSLGLAEFAGGLLV